MARKSLRAVAGEATTWFRIGNLQVRILDHFGDQVREGIRYWTDVDCAFVPSCGLLLVRPGAAALYIYPIPAILSLEVLSEDHVKRVLDHIRDVGGLA